MSTIPLKQEDMNEDKKAFSKEHRKVGLASFIGTTIEWYDFYLYGTAAALVFPALFFPTFDPLYGTLAAFGSYAAGFIARPLGSAVFGHFGDKVGRKGNAFKNGTRKMLSFMSRINTNKAAANV